MRGDEGTAMEQEDIRQEALNELHELSEAHFAPSDEES